MLPGIIQMRKKSILQQYATPRFAIVVLLVAIAALFVERALFDESPSAQAQTSAMNFLAAGLQGAQINNPTSLQFGPDDRLYVSQQDGTIFAYTIQRNGPADYEVIDTETINIVKQIPNHDDDGTLNDDKTQRQITGLYVTGTGTNPVLYVTSSDWRIGGGDKGSDKNLDTNSGILSRLTWDSTNGVWDKVDLVRGLPRSEENHATNGIALDEANNVLYLAAGGNTNAGSPSFKFAKISEYALSAAILKIDLAALDNMPIQGSGNTKYVYDLPTLDDPTRANVNGITDPNAPGYDGIDVNDPFGGNDGLNQAKIVPGGPVQVYAAGFRNPYDVIITTTPGRAGRMYSIDNGANGGWGGHPDQEGPQGTCTNNYVPGEPGSSSAGPNDGKVNNKDNLHFITGEGYYRGHPNPIRGNPAGAGLYTDDNGNDVFRTAVTGDPATTLPVDWPPVPVSMARPQECDFRNPGVDDGSLLEWNSSTNGLAEYTASNFDEGLKGNLLAASFDGTIYRIILSEDGTAVLNGKEPFASSFGATPLDVVAQGDNDVFGGTVWAATYGADAITVFEPADYDGQDPGLCTGADDDALDEDSDGYNNADEIDNGTNPCSAASKPSDNDGDLTSDLNDDDDDNDGQLDHVDFFPIDPNNGLTTNLPINYTLLNNDPGTGFFGLGFTGLMSDGVSDYRTLFDPDNLVAGGAVGLFTITDTTNGDAQETFNNQREAFHFGINVNANTKPFLVRAVALGGPFFQPAPPTGAMSQGMYIGTGDQKNFLKIAVSAAHGGSIQVLYEHNDTIVQNNTYPVADIVNRSDVNLYLYVDPAAGTVQPLYAVEGGAAQAAGPVITLVSPSPLLDALQNANKALAVGLIATSRGGATFNATWDHIDVIPEPTGQWYPVEPSDSSSPTARHENAYVEVNGKFYLIGGRGSSKTVDIFDPTTKTWVSGQNTPPFEIHHFQAVEWGGKIYIVGAFTGKYPDETPVEHVYIYDPATDQWSQGPEIPANRRRGSAGAVVYNNKIYVVAGIQNGHQSGHVAWFDEFDPATGTWTPLADAPRTRDHFQAAVIDDKLYAVGGRNTGLNGEVFKFTVPEVDVYDFTTQQWSTLPNPLPTERAAPAVVALGNELLVIGGESGSQELAHNETEALNVLTGLWRTLDTLITGRHGTQAILHNGGIYIAAGSGEKGSSPELTSQEVFYMTGSQSPTSLTATPTSLHFFSQTQNSPSAPKELELSNEGDQALDVTAVTITGPNAGEFTHNFTAPFTIDAHATAKLNVIFTPTAAGLKTATLNISHSASSSPITIPLTGEGVGADVVDGILYRINVGGPLITAESGPNWSADSDAQPSPYRLNGKVDSTADSVQINGTVPAGTPAGLFQTNRYDAGKTGDPMDKEMQWDLPVTAGTPIEIRLYFAETYLNGIGQRLFDIEVDGTVPAVFDDLDLMAEAGHDVGFMKSYQTTSDGNVDLDFYHVLQNPLVSAIEILDVTPNTPPTVVNPIADFAVQENSAPTTIDLSSVFADAEDGAAALSYSISNNSNPALVSTAVNGVNLVLSYTPGTTGSASLSVKAVDTRGMSVEEQFTVTVSATPNNAPTAGPPPVDIRIPADGTPTTVDLTTIFSDDQDAPGSLLYSVENNSHPNLVSAQIEGSNLVLSQAGSRAAAAAIASADVEVSITVRATDSGGLSTDVVLTVQAETASGPNTDPFVVKQIANLTVDMNSAPATIDLNGIFGDHEQDSASLVLSVSNNTQPALVSTAVNGTQLTLSFTAGASGFADITVRATDSGGLWAEDTFRVIVVDRSVPNQPPVLAEIDYPTVKEGQTLDLEVSATDADGDGITLEVQNLPAGAEFVDRGDGTGILTWKPGQESAGSYALTVVATDTRGATDSQPLNITVLDSDTGGVVLEPKAFLPLIHQ